jgi:hypothetical protein
VSRPLDTALEECLRDVHADLVKELRRPPCLAEIHVLIPDRSAPTLKAYAERLGLPLKDGRGVWTKTAELKAAVGVSGDVTATSGTI